MTYHPQPSSRPFALLVSAALLVPFAVRPAKSEPRAERPSASVHYGGSERSKVAKVNGPLRDLVAELGKRYPRLAFDGRLDVAAEHLAANWPSAENQPEPSATLLGRVMEHFGIGRPSPYVLVAECKREKDGPEGPGLDCAERALLAKAPALLAQPELSQAASTGQRLIVGLGVADANGARRVVFLVAPERLRLDRISRELAPGNVTLSGVVPASSLALRAVASVPAPPSEKGGGAQMETRELAVEVSRPDARTKPRSKKRPKGPPSAPEQVRFAVTFPCGAAPATMPTGSPAWPPGMYEIELLGSGRQGPHVLFNLPLYCGVRAPALLPLVGPSASAPVVPSGKGRSAAELARLLFDLTVTARNREKSGPLAWDDALAKVATAHAQDMANHGFVGHVSPSTGAPKNRLDAAGIGFRVVLENVAASATPEEAIDGFLGSPGHRKNLLSNAVNRAGMGASQKNGRWYFVQLFIL